MVTRILLQEPKIIYCIYPDRRTGQPPFLIEFSSDSDAATWIAKWSAGTNPDKGQKTKDVPYYKP